MGPYPKMNKTWLEFKRTSCTTNEQNWYGYIFRKKAQREREFLLWEGILRKFSIGTCPKWAGNWERRFKLHCFFRKSGAAFSSSKTCYQVMIRHKEKMKEVWKEVVNFSMLLLPNFWFCSFVRFCVLVKACYR